MTELTATALQQQIANSSQPVFVDIYSPQCGPCRTLLPVLDELATEFHGNVNFVKLNALSDDAAAEACVTWGVRSVPTLLIFKDGTEKARRTGATSKAQLKSWIEDSVKA
jgi:thioredoxin 1